MKPSKYTPKQPIKKQPIADIKPVEAHKESVFDIYYKQFKIAFWVSIFAILIILPLSSIKVGIPADEPIDLEYGKLSYQYFSSLGKDTTFSNFKLFQNQAFPHQKFYGAGYETFTVAVAKIFSTDFYKTRHFLTGLIGVILILFTGLIGKEARGWGVGLIAVWLIFLTPTVTGNAFFNTKDIPYAATMAISLYFFIRLIKELPNPTKITIAGCLLGIAFAVGIRIGGLILLPYVFVFVLYMVIFDKKSRIEYLKKRNLIKIIIIGLVVCIGGVFIGLLMYPNFYRNGIQHVIESFNLARNFPFRIRLIFEGKIINSTEIPQTYILKYLLITLPLSVILGLLLTIPFAKKLYQDIKRPILFILFFATIFPVIYIIKTHAPVYNGWRHVLFIAPSFIVLSALGIYAFIDYFKKKVVIIILTVFVVLLMAKPAIWMVKNHPYSYMYYNELIGGVKGAYGKYDTDYQQIGASLSLKWLMENESFASNDKKMIASNNRSLYFSNVDTNKTKIFECGFLGFSPIYWDYAIFSSVFVPKDVIKFAYPPKNSIHIEDVDGVPISAVVKHENKDDFTGMTYLINNNIDSAFIYLEKAYEYDPQNFRIFHSVAYCNAVKGNRGKAVNVLSTYLLLFPDNKQAKELMNSIR